MKRLSCVLFAAFCAVLQPAPVAADNDAPHLRVGLEDLYRPFAFTDKNGAHVGFDHDIATALCAAMNARCEYVILPLDLLLTSMEKGELDFVVAGLAAKEERKLFMDFTEPYYRSRTIYVGKRAETASTPEGLKGKKIGAQGGTMQELYIRQHWADIATVVTASHEAILDMLIKGDLDVVLVDGLAGYDFLKTPQGAPFDILGDPLLPDEVFSQACIGVRKGANDIKTALDKALIFIRLNGEYDRINRKYFSFSIY